jgi:uncharacterized phage protein (TIGR01671 family)
MTQIVKFKALHKKDKIILEWNVIKQSAWNDRECSLMYDILVRRKDDYVVLPFTGRTDKNGRDIYAGDNCKCFNLTLSEPLLGVIEYNDELTAYVLRLKTDNSYSVLYGFHEIEIIGSVYQQEPEE